MTPPLKTITAQSDTNATVTTTTELAVIEVAVTRTGPARRITLRGRLTLASGTGTTDVNVRIRRGSGITGTVVGEQGATGVLAAAGTVEAWERIVVDTIDEPAGQIYTLTVQQTGASANGTVQTAFLEALVQ